jgi:L,D-transpeptidase ErfK/SrfK
VTGAAGPAAFAFSDSAAAADTLRIASRPGGYGRGSPRALAFFALVLSLAGSFTRAQSGPGPLVGGPSLYQVKRGDSLTLLGARFGVDTRLLARANGLSPQARLSVGQSLRLENRHVVPDAGDGIIVNIPQRLLFFFHDGALAAWYPVALGRPDWQTPTGRFEVVSLRRRPTWHVPPSIQEEMRRQGKPVQTVVPPGPQNPLGKQWIGLSASFCGIHGTNAPASIYSFRTHGCIRLHPDDAADLFARVSIGTPVEIAYEPVLLRRQPDGAVFLEVNPDIYGRAADLRALFEAAASRQHVLDIVDPARVDAVLADRAGIAERIDRARPE